MKNDTKRLLVIAAVILIIVLTSFERFKDIVQHYRAHVTGYYEEQIAGSLFLHINKSIYIPNENIWFKAYLLNTSLNHEVLYVRLIDNQKRIIKRQQFIMDGVQSNGEMLLPIDLPPGQYQIMAYTDKMINFNPENIFVQQIQVLDLNHSTVTSQGQSKNLTLRSPKVAEDLIIRYYPESGRLINHTANRLLISIANSNGIPLVTKASIQCNNLQIGSSMTNSNGLAYINFTPDVQHKYHLVIEHARNGKITTLPLHIDTAGYTMKLIDQDDQRMLMIKNEHMEGNVRLLGKTLSAILLHKTIQIKNGDSITVPLLHTDDQNHVLDLGLFDQEHKLLAERMVYLPVKEKYQITLSFDQPDYSSREKVRAHISVKDINGKDVSAQLSIAVIAKSTLDSSLSKRITEIDLNALRFHQRHKKDISILNNELIRDTFRSGSWEEVMNYQPKQVISIFSNTAGVFGFVTPKKNKRRKLPMLYLYGKSAIQTVPVNSNGAFSISAIDLNGADGKSNYLIVDPDFHKNYDLTIKDYATDFDGRISLAYLPRVLPTEKLTESSAQLTSLLSGNILKEVVIKAKKNTVHGDGRSFVTDYHSINCSDYVCHNNILNCKVHPNGGFPPVEEQIYVLNGRQVRYYGCVAKNTTKSNTYELKTIQSARAYQLPDYSNVAAATTDLQSTLFWEPNLTTPVKGSSTIEFDTSDLKGVFTIVIQGLTISGSVPVFGMSEFIVRQQKIK